MAFKKTADERRSLRAGRKRGVRGHTRAQVGVVVPVHKERQDFELLQEEVAGNADAVERLITQADELDRRSATAAGLVVRGPLADKGERPDALQAEGAAIESLAEGEVDVVAAMGGQAAATGEAHVAVIAAKHGDRVARVTVLGVPGEFNAELVVTVAEVVRTAGNVVVINLVEAAVSGKKEETLFGNEVVHLELAGLDFEPAAVLNVVDTYPSAFEVPGGSIIRRGQQLERDVLVEGAGGPEVHAGKVEAVLLDFSGDQRRAGSSTRNRVNGKVVGAFAVPVRRDAEGDREVGGVLPDGRVALVAKLVAVIAKDDAEIVELRPGGVTGKERQAIFSGECGNRADTEVAQRSGFGRGAASEHRHQEERANKQQVD